MPALKGRMKMRKFANLVALISLLTSVPSFGGDSSSGGGDYLRFHFEEGRQQSLQILKNLDLSKLPKDTPTDVQDWLTKNSKALAQELKTSELTWLENSEQETCARTAYEMGAPIRLSFKRCFGYILHKEDAGKLLLHEASHHLGVKEETFADLIGIHVYRAWETQQIVELSLCADKKPIGKYLAGKWGADKNINAYLPGHPRTEILDATIEFTSDLSVLKTFKARKGECVYDAGLMTVKSSKFNLEQAQYVLHHDDKGRMYVSYFWTQNKTRRDEGFIVFLAISKRDERDPVLFVGGDQDHEPVSALRKIE